VVNKPSTILGFNVDVVEDYLLSVRYQGGKEEKIDLPESNVLKFIMSDGSWFVLRPSGTEPKLKIYIGVLSDNLEDSRSKNESIKKEVTNIIDTI
jgi:phosphoglucomutase